jgi:hypothetical protein
LEKTPQNAARIGWLETLESSPRYVHIVRDGMSVVRSIARLASNPTYRLALKPHYNQWWGERETKWDAIRKSGCDHGYFTDCIDQISTHEQRAAYEWLLSLQEIDRHRDALGNRLLEITYNELTQDPRSVLNRIADHFGFPAPAPWVELAVSKIQPERVYEHADLKLPKPMVTVFNEYQERYGFTGAFAISNEPISERQA